MCLLSIFVLLQLFIDVVFAFIVYMTGVAILQLVTLFNKHYEFLSYGAFKEAHNIKSLSKTLYQIGCVIWLSIFLVVFLTHFAP